MYTNQDAIQCYTPIFTFSTIQEINNISMQDDSYYDVVPNILLQNGRFNKHGNDNKIISIPSYL